MAFASFSFLSGVGIVTVCRPRILSKNKTEYRGTFKDNKKDGKGYLITKDKRIFFQLWNMDNFVTQKPIDFETLQNSEFNYEKEFQEKITGRNQEIIKKFETRIGNTSKMMVPDKLESSPNDTFNNSKRGQNDEATSGKVKIGSLSFRLSRNFDSISLMDYNEQLRSIFSENELKNVKEWDFEQVAEFLCKIGMKEYQELFLRAKIDGLVLLKMKESDFNLL